MAAPRSPAGDEPGKAWVRARLRDLGDAGRLGRRTGASPLTVRLSAGPFRASGLPLSAGPQDPPDPPASAADGSVPVASRRACADVPPAPGADSASGVCAAGAGPHAREP